MEQARRFIADAMLGKLAKWLRILGFDVAYERIIEDQALIRRAKLENREILTRDRRLVQRRWGSSIHFIYIEDDHLPDQLLQVFRELGSIARKPILSRCIRCNEPLSILLWKKAAGRVPSYVYRTHKRFFECPRCRRLYWAGSHRRRILKQVQTLAPQYRAETRHRENIK